MSNADKPAFPINTPVLFKHMGLTKREYFAGLAMQGLLSGDIEGQIYNDRLCDIALECADILLAKLEESQ